MNRQKSVFPLPLSLSFLKRIFVLMLMMPLCLACSEDEKNLIEQKYATLDSLRQEFTNLQVEIESLEQELAELDSSFGLKKNSIKVQAAKVQLQDFKRMVEVQAETRSKQNILINPEINANVFRIFVSEGQEVKKGQALVQLDQENFRDNLSELEKAYELANKVYEKRAALWEDNIGSELEYLQAKNEKESLEKRINSAKTQLSKSVIRAPFAGMVDEIMLNEGEFATPQSPALRLVNLKQMRAVAHVSEKYVGIIRPNDTVSVKFSNSDKHFKTPVVFVGKHINPGNRTFKIEAELNNEEAKLKPNMVAALNFMDYKSADAVVVPARIIQQSTTESFVFVVDDQKGIPIARKRKVEVGATYKGTAEILSGLEAGEQIITTGAENVLDNDPIEIID